MLKLKDDIDLKELEKFGFKPFYNCDTGEIDYWYKKIYDLRFRSIKYSEYIIKIELKNFSYYDNGIRKKKKEIKNLIKLKQASEGDAYYLFFDTLFDLIQAGLVEKVGE